MNTRPRPAIAMPVRRLLPPNHGKAGHRDTHRPAPQLVSGRAHPELHRYSAAPCRSPKTNSDKAGTAVSSHRSPAIERTYEPRNVRQRPLITAITQLSLHLMAHQNRSTLRPITCDDVSEPDARQPDHPPGWDEYVNGPGSAHERSPHFHDAGSALCSRRRGRFHPTPSQCRDRTGRSTVVRA